MANNNGGPWGGGSGGNQNGGNNNGGGGGGRRPPEGPQIPEIDEIMKKGQEQLKVLMGGRGGGNGANGGGGGEGPKLTRGTIYLGLAVLVGLYLYASFYTVRPEEQGVELFLGSEYRVTDEGPHFAWWPFVTAEVIATTTQRTEQIGVSSNSRTSSDNGLMLTTDENIVDIDFQVVWNINNPSDFLFNLADGRGTVIAVAESAMREIIAGSELAPILNRDRELIAQNALTLIQGTLDSYESGINIVRVTMDRADPPREVIDAFRDVQAAEQERDRVQREADAYANRVVAEARGEAAQLRERAEGYRAQVVNEAEGEASRFTSVLEEYLQAPEVTRRRLYIETIERIFSDVDKIILDQDAGGQGGQGVVPYLPLNELRRSTGGQ